MQEYRKKGTVKAEKYYGAPCVLNTSWGRQEVQDGDYIVYSNGESCPVKAEVFEKTYEEVK